MNVTTLTLEFKRGDVLQLVSGGPPMTAFEIHRADDPDGPFIKCRWFTPDGMLQWASFAAPTVKPYPPVIKQDTTTYIRPVHVPTDDSEAMPR